MHGVFHRLHKLLILLKTIAVAVEDLSADVEIRLAVRPQREPGNKS